MATAGYIPDIYRMATCCRGSAFAPRRAMDRTRPTVLSAAQVTGFVYLGLIGGAATYFLWFRGISKLGPSSIAPLGLLSPVTAVLLGWGVLHQNLTLAQTAGMILVLVSVWLGQRAQKGASVSKEQTGNA